MRPNRHVGPILSVCLAATGIAVLLYISALWCAVADFADSQVRPAATIGQYVPPPGPVYLENDSYYWLSYAQRIANGEDWRIRHTDMDGFPTGREVHWSQVVSWSMVAFGKVRAVFTHETIHTAIERASVAINPLLYALAAAGLFVALAWRLGVLPAALFVTFLSSSGDIGWTFQPLRPGHQVFHLVFGALSVVPLIFGGMGLVARERSPSKSWLLFQALEAVDATTAKRCFLLAGVFTGLALWVSATIESFFIYPLAVTFVFLLALVPRAKVESGNLVLWPELWRWWGLTAGATGFLFYLIEYFPHHLAMRLEVNHPVYDLAVVGLGESMRMLTLLRWGEVRVTLAHCLLTGSAMAVAALPILMVMRGPVDWHHMRDPQMLRLHNFIQEFYTYSNLVQTDRLGHFFHLYGIIPVVSLLAPSLLFRREVSVTQITWLACTFALACSFGVVAFLQIRWMGFYAAAACLSALVSAHSANAAISKPRWLRREAAAVLIVLALLVQPVVFFRRQIVNLQMDLQGLAIEHEIIVPILNKRLACALKASPNCPKTVIADPGLAPSLGYFAGISCLTSFYWENLDGLHEATRFFATKDPAEARAVALETGATHVIMPPGEMLPNYFYFIACGQYDPTDAKRTLGARLIAGTVPIWIQPDTVLNFITTQTYSYRGARLGNHLETFRIQD